MAETNYKKLLGLMGGTALLAVGLTLSGCASAPEKKAAEGGAKSEAASSSDQGQSSQGEATQTSGGEAATGSAGSGKKAAKAAPKPAKAEAPKPDISGSDVTAVENKMKVFPRVLWHSHTNTYRFYVGTVLFAQYNPFDETFEVMTDNADRKNLVCKYAPDKGWKVEGKSKGQTCDGLLKRMNDYLAHPFS